MADDAPEPDYVRIRDAELLGQFLGHELVEVTQHDRDEYSERGCFVVLHFSNGRSVTFHAQVQGADFMTVEQPNDEADDTGEAEP